MRHVDRMVEELMKTGKTHTIVRWGRWPSYYQKDYTDKVIEAVGEGDYLEGKKYLTIDNDAPKGGILGTLVKFNEAGMAKFNQK